MRIYLTNSQDRICLTELAKCVDSNLTRVSVAAAIGIPRPSSDACNISPARIFETGSPLNDLLFNLNVPEGIITSILFEWTSMASRSLLELYKAGNLAVDQENKAYWFFVASKTLGSEHL